MSAYTPWAPPGTRTQNLRIKSPLLYRLSRRCAKEPVTILRVNEGTRTPDLLDHNQALQPTELRPPCRPRTVPAAQSKAEQQRSGLRRSAYD